MAWTEGQGERFKVAKYRDEKATHRWKTSWDTHPCWEAKEAAEVPIQEESLP